MLVAGPGSAGICTWPAGFHSHKLDQHIMQVWLYVAFQVLPSHPRLSIAAWPV